MQSTQMSKAIHNDYQRVGIDQADDKRSPVSSREHRNNDIDQWFTFKLKRPDKKWQRTSL